MSPTNVQLFLLTFSLLLTTTATRDTAPGEHPLYPLVDLAPIGVVLSHEQSADYLPGR